MQFRQIATIAALSVAAQASYNTTVVGTATAMSTDVETITSCAPTVTDCPANKNSTSHSISTWEAGAVKNSVGLAAVAVVGAAVLGL